MAIGHLAKYILRNSAGHREAAEGRGSTRGEAQADAGCSSKRKGSKVKAGSGGKGGAGAAGGDVSDGGEGVSDEAKLERVRAELAANGALVYDLYTFYSGMRQLAAAHEPRASFALAISLPTV